MTPLIFLDIKPLTEWSVFNFTINLIFGIIELLNFKGLVVMINIISVVTTCSIIIILNVVMVVRDAKFKRRFEDNMHFKVKKLEEDNYYLNQDINKLNSDMTTVKDELMNIHQNLMDMKVEFSKDALVVNKHFSDVDVKVDLALISIKNIQDKLVNQEEGV